MKARKYTDRISFFEMQEVTDGYGGFINTEVFLFDKWASKETSSAGFKFQQFGLNDFKNPIVFRIRKGDNQINEKMFINFQDHKYFIKAVENVNLDNLELNIFCDGN